MDALFGLRDSAVLTEGIVDKLIALWNALPFAFKKAKVLYPSRYWDDAKHTCRFMQKKPAEHMQTVTPGTVSLRR